MERVLVDTGFLVALARERDANHEAAVGWLATTPRRLVTVTAVIVETCHFLHLQARSILLDWLATEATAPAVIDVPPQAYPDLVRTMQRYKERDIDFADAALVWLAQETGDRAILTVDDGDFTRFRLKGGARLELVSWR